MKDKKIFFISGIFISLFINTFLLDAYATNGMKTIGIGPVQRSMGGASVGVPLDSGTVITNPAGMREAGRRIDLGITFFSPDVNYQATGMVTVNNRIMDSDMRSAFIPFLGAIVPVTDMVCAGFAANGAGGMGVDYKSNLYNNRTYTDYTFLKTATGVAVNITEEFAVGAAFNIDFATMEFEAGTTREVPHDDGTAAGFGFTLGGYYRPFDFLSLGVAWESKQVFRDFKFDTKRGVDKLDFNQPQTVTGGIGIRPFDVWDIAFDIVWIDWPQATGKNRPGYRTNSSGAAVWDMNWEEQWVFKIGTECRVTKSIALRAGYNYGRMPVDSMRAFENIAFPAIVEHHVTCGAGINITDKLILNIGFMYAPEARLDTANTAQFINSATTKMRQFSLEAGLSYEF